MNRPAALCSLALGLVAALSGPASHAQSAPPAQTGGFAIADQIRSARSQSVGRAVAIQQADALEEIHAATVAQQELAAASQPLRVTGDAAGGFAIEGGGPPMGQGLLGGSVVYAVQVIVQNGQGNVAGNALDALQATGLPGATPVPAPVAPAAAPGG